MQAWVVNHVPLSFRELASGAASAGAALLRRLQGGDVLQLLLQRAFGHFEIVGLPHREPDFRTAADQLADAERKIGGDRLLLVEHISAG